MNCHPLESDLRHTSTTNPGWRAGLAAVAFVIAAMAISGCNTVEGAGKDVESVGEAVQDAAD